MKYSGKDLLHFTKIRKNFSAASEETDRPESDGKVLRIIVYLRGRVVKELYGL